MRSADEARLVEARPFGRAHLHLEAPLVVDRQEPLVRLAGERHARAERRRAGDDHDPAVAHDEAEHARRTTRSMGR